MPIQEQVSVPAAVTAVRELKADVHGPDDEAVLAAWKKEVGKDRARALAELGQHAVQSDLIESNGVAVPEHVVQEAREAGQDMTDPYNSAPHDHS
jgi:hypothetical protein